MESKYRLSLGADPTAYLVPAELRHRVHLVEQELFRARGVWKRTGDRSDFASAFDEQERLFALVRACPKAK